MDEDRNFWMSTMTRRISRRTALRAAGLGGAGLAAAALIGCGDDDEAARPPAPAAAQATAASPQAPKVSAEAPKSGGTLRIPSTAPPDSLDPYKSAGSTFYSQAGLVYSHLLTMEVGDGETASGRVTGDLAETWEQPDLQTIVIHLNPAAKFDELAPLNGRAVTTEDVVLSWDKYAADSIYRAEMVNEANENTPFLGVEAVDERTARFDMAFPDSTALLLLGGGGYVFIQPAEVVSGQIDSAKEIRGSGPFLFNEYRTAVSTSFTRNPAWFGGPERPHIDGIHVPIIPDAAQREIQFRAKNLHMLSVSPENIPLFAKELGGTELVSAGAPRSQKLFGLSYVPGQPWHDVRVRRAVSMALDRDVHIDVIENPQQYEELGLTLNQYWPAPFNAAYGAYWMDPKGSEFGPAAKYLFHNPEEAKKLLDAAGYGPDKPLEFDAVWASRYGQNWLNRAEVWGSMLADVGVKMNFVPLDYATEFIPNYFRAGATFEGKNVKAAVNFNPGSGAADALLWYFRIYGSSSASSQTGEYWPEIDGKLQAIRALPTFEERVAGVKDFSRFAIDQMIAIPADSGVDKVEIVWEALRGPGQYRQYKGGLTFNPHIIPRYWFREQI